MEKYICTICEYVYDPELGDPENGIEPGTSFEDCLLYTSPSPRDRQKSRMPSSA